MLVFNGIAAEHFLDRPTEAQKARCNKRVLKRAFMIVPACAVLLLAKKTRHDQVARTLAQDTHLISTAIGFQHRMARSTLARPALRT